VTLIGTPMAPPAALGRDFHLLWFGEGVSVLGNATTAVLLPLLAVVGFGAGPGWMGALTAAAWLPWLVIGLPAGAWVDRLPPRSVMIVSDLVAAALLASIPIGHALGVLSLLQLLLVATGSGACTVFFRTAYVKLIPEVASDGQFESANARLFGTESAMQVVGPGVGGLLVQWFSAAFGLILDSVSFLVSALCLWRIRPTQIVPTASADAADAARRTPMGEQIREGVRFVWGDRSLRWLTLIGGISNLGLTGYAALLVLYLVRDLGLSPSSVGTVLMLGSSGGLLGSLVATRLVRRFGSGRASTVLLVCGGPPALLLPLAEPGWRVGAVVLGLMLVGICVVAGNVVRSAWRQRYVPRELMGRAITASQMVNFGTMPIAGVLAGWMGSHVGVRATIAVMGAIHATACLSILVSPFRGLRELPERPALPS
jgi:MFS family permease